MKHIYTVYHCTDLRAMSNPVLGKRLWTDHRDHYRKVAEVEASSLDEVFWLTNHITGNWQDHADVQVLVNEPVRSTSVGDVLVQGEDAWLVEPFGFTAMAEAR